MREKSKFLSIIQKKCDNISLIVNPSFQITYRQCTVQASFAVSVIVKLKNSNILRSLAYRGKSHNKAIDHTNVIFLSISISCWLFSRFSKHVPY